MDHDFANAFVDAPYRDVLRRERNDLSANFDPTIVVRDDAHRVADLARVRIVRIVLGDSFRAGLCRDAKGFVGGHFFASPMSDSSHAALPSRDLAEAGENLVESRDHLILLR